MNKVESSSSQQTELLKFSNLLEVSNKRVELNSVSSLMSIANIVLLKWIASHFSIFVIKKNYCRKVLNFMKLWDIINCKILKP